MSDGAPKPPPEYDPKGPLVRFWGKTLGEVVELDDPRRFHELERDLVHSLLVMALVAHYWNGNKRRAILRPGSESYPGRAKQRISEGLYEGGDYLGHNISCVEDLQLSFGGWHPA